MAPSFWNDVMSLLQHGSSPAPDSIPRSPTTLLSFSSFPEYLHHPHSHLADITAAYIKLREDAQSIYPYLDQPTELTGLSSPARSTVAPSSSIHRGHCFSTSSKHYSPCIGFRKCHSHRGVDLLLRANYQRG